MPALVKAQRHDGGHIITRRKAVATLNTDAGWEHRSGRENVCPQCRNAHQHILENQDKNEDEAWLPSPFSFNWNRVWYWNDKGSC